jgi:hypothetical protein
MLVFRQYLLENVVTMQANLEQSPDKDFENYYVNINLLNLQLLPMPGSVKPRLFDSMQHLWSSNGFAVGENQRNEIMILPNQDQQSYVILRSSYNGLDNQGLIDRQRKLSTYRTDWDNMKSLNPSMSKAELKISQVKLSQKLIGYEYSNGLRGVETFTASFVERQVAERMALGRLSISLADIASWRSYALPEEHETYDTPDVIGDFPAFRPHTPQTYSKISDPSVTVISPTYLSNYLCYNFEQ